MEAKQMAKNVTVKTLDGTITRKSKEDDSIHALSMKCTDINLQMFHNFGVSKPILNYVIFCHQEDSNWPLDEGSKVKDKFDEIFASAKYKECLKKIKEVRANHMQQEKLEKKELEYLSSEKKEAKQKKKNLKDKENARKVMEDEVAELTENSKPKYDELKVINAVHFNFNTIREEMAGFESDLKNCKHEMSELKPKVLRLLPDSIKDGDIQRMKEELDVTIFYAIRQ
jgi:DNA repair protein RAD50